ncbi:hypothetical protein ES702_06417 [subsurface metagenome]
MLFEERSDEFHVFPETRRRVEIIQGGYRVTERNRPEVLLDKKVYYNNIKNVSEQNK